MVDGSAAGKSSAKSAMFNFHEALTPSLEPRDYWSHEVFEAEVDSLFRRHWHQVALEKDLARSGDTLTCEVLGARVVIRNAGGMLEATAGRKSVRVEIFCAMIFVNLAEDAPTIRAYFGAIGQELEAHFRGYRPFWSWATEHDTNWKIVIENTVEGYHVPVLHPTTFITYPEEKDYRHVLESDHSIFENLAAGGWADKWMGPSLMLKDPQPRNHTQIHVFPNYLVDYMGVARIFFFPMPLSARRTRFVMHAFMPGDVRRGPLARLSFRRFSQWIRDIYERVLLEDMTVWPQVQRGTEHSSYRGILSAREERVYHFQKYVDGRVRPQNKA
jgi:choline monooxygenase